MKGKAGKEKDSEAVAVYMSNLRHPLKLEINELRSIIKAAHPGIGERIKWNAPSYYYKEDMVTFHLRATEHVHLIFHHPYVAEINSPILVRHYDKRRMLYLKNIDEVKSNKAELQRIMIELVQYQG